MLLQPLHSVNYSDFHVSGDVTIHPNVAIAPGVLIQADPDSQIIIESGTCIGMGTIIHACKGNIEIKSGVTIGTGVLIIGAVEIGSNTCIGSMTTVFNQVIPPAELVLAGSLLGVNTSRQPEESATPSQLLVSSIPKLDQVNQLVNPLNNQPEIQAPTIELQVQVLPTQPANQPLPEFAHNQYQDPQTYKPTFVVELPPEVQVTASSPDLSKPSIVIKEPVIKESIKVTEPSPQVYGQENLNRLLAKLLPHRQSLNTPLNNT